jgi:hypothetical protein
VGSSSRSRLGWVMSSWARLTRLRCPPEMPLSSGEPIRTSRVSEISSCRSTRSMIWQISLWEVSDGSRSRAV